MDDLMWPWPHKLPTTTLHRNHHHSQQLFVGQIDLRKWLCADDWWCSAAQKSSSFKTRSSVSQSMVRWWLCVVEVGLPGSLYYQPKQCTRWNYSGNYPSKLPYIDLLLLSSTPKWVPFNDPCFTPVDTQNIDQLHSCRPKWLDCKAFMPEMSAISQGICHEKGIHPLTIHPWTEPKLLYRAKYAAKKRWKHLRFLVLGTFKSIILFSSTATHYLYKNILPSTQRTTKTNNKTDSLCIPRTQMTLVLIGKGLVLEGWHSKIEVSWLLGI